MAAEMLINPGGTIWLLATKSTRFTANRLADWLRSWFKAQGMSPMPVVDTPAGTSDYLDEADAAEIFRATSVVLNKIAASYQNRQIGQVGLNYTGGTKAMSVHTYRAVDTWQRKQLEDRRLSTPVQFSYTDARRLSIRIDVQGEIPAIHISAWQIVKFTLQDLLNLHGRELFNPPTTRAVLATTARAWAIEAG